MIFRLTKKSFIQIVILQGDKDVDWSIPVSSPDVVFNGTDSSDQCCHFMNPARIVCCEGYDYGRRFLVCPVEVSELLNFSSKWHCKIHYSFKNSAVLY